MKKRILSLLLALVVCLGVFAGCTGVDVTPIASINGVEIVKGEYLFYCEQLGLNIAGMYAQYGYDVSAIWDMSYDEEMTMGDYVKKASMEQLIEVNVLVGKAEELGITLTAEEKAAAQSSKKDLVTALGSADAYKNFRKAVSLTDSEILGIFEKMALATKVKETVIAEDERFTAVTEEAVGEWYEGNYFKAQHILVTSTYQAPAPEVTEAPVTEAPAEGEEVEVTEEPTAAPTVAPTAAPAEPTMTPDEYKEDAKTRAEDLLAQVLGGADFESLMKEFSEDPGSKTSPEGYVFTEGEMVTEFEEAVKALEVGAVTQELVESSYGWHIIKRLDLTREDKDFTENYESYMETYQNSLWTDLLTEWRDAAEIEVYDKVQSKVKMADLYWAFF